MRGYQSHESFWADFKMYRNLFSRALLLGVLAQILFIFCIWQGLAKSANQIRIRDTGERMPISVFGNYFFSLDLANQGISVEPELRKYVNQASALPRKTYQQFADWLTNNAYQKLRHKFDIWFRVSFVSYLLTVLYLVIFLRTAPRMEVDKFVRGAVLLPL